MPADARRASPPRKHPAEGIRVPPRADARSTCGAVSAGRDGATLARKWRRTAQLAPTPKRTDLRSTPRSPSWRSRCRSGCWPRAARGRRRSSRRSRSLLTALASLPLVARRPRRSRVFVLTALASTALRGDRGRPRALRSARPSPSSPWPRRGDGSRARTRLTLAVVATCSPRTSTASGLARRPLPRRRAPVRRARSGAAPGWRATARGCGASGWPSWRSGRCAPSARPSASAGWRRPRSARASPATCTTPRATRST